MSHPIPQDTAALFAWFRQFNLAVVIPAYNVEREIGIVLNSLPTYISQIIVVDDASTDATHQILQEASLHDERLIVLQHSSNQGVGGAMITGFRHALGLGAQVVIKFDGDGQMDPKYLPELLLPLLWGSADYTKGNRFRDFHALQQMPLFRRAGNMALSFISKLATGYWSCFDPTNGFLAIRGDVLKELPLEDVHRSYFFEISMLSRLYLLGAFIREVPMPAKYGGETSHLSITRILCEFPGKLLKCLARRLILKNFIYEFSMESIYLLAGLPLFLTGVVFGGYNWVIHAMNHVQTPTGTIMIATLFIILGFQLLLSAIGLDLQNSPKEPIGSGPLREWNKQHTPISEEELVVKNLGNLLPATLTK
jgi:glycosyltransferase involved in cell wall biosynthesis